MKEKKKKPSEMEALSQRKWQSPNETSLETTEEKENNWKPYKPTERQAARLRGHAN